MMFVKMSQYKFRMRCKGADCNRVSRKVFWRDTRSARAQHRSSKRENGAPMASAGAGAGAAASKAVKKEELVEEDDDFEEFEQQGKRSVLHAGCARDPLRQCGFGESLAVLLGEAMCARVAVCPCVGGAVHAPSQGCAAGPSLRVAAAVACVGLTGRAVDVIGAQTGPRRWPPPPRTKCTGKKTGTTTTSRTTFQNR